MGIGGELAFILSDIDFSSKKELLDKLRKMRIELKKYPQKEREIIQPMLDVAIQQVFYTNEFKLFRFKNWDPNKRSNKYGNRDEKNCEIDS